MIQWFNKKLKNRKGFTLIELIVVIAILGILALIAIPRFTGTLNNARASADDATFRVIQSAVSLYVAENGPVAADGTDLFSALTTGGAYLDADNLKWSDDSAITAISVNVDGSVAGTTPTKP
ncbi:competence type IV pilus major pilin ComGC [Anoxynatronum buryatiense]|uniref:Type IV pilus assembly protein PilA n=1 Tax=Anoxynatronum buryatiense TaxID=489973 RepID=A0AA45WVK7_9CLOT|nr:prepilin-type N-terminal cleavage/methylation domain-containing protein [Anoxynatronum buryatiense]SMP48858.1 type IV pilus assembly protein PilA [Anoxynatronum buryatiense]